MAVYSQKDVVFLQFERIRRNRERRAGHRKEMPCKFVCGIPDSFVTLFRNNDPGRRKMVLCQFHPYPTLSKQKRLFVYRILSQGSLSRCFQTEIRSAYLYKKTGAV